MAQADYLAQEVRKLLLEALRVFRRWFLAFDAELWDMQLEKDVKVDKLDALGGEAIDDLLAGRDRPL